MLIGDGSIEVPQDEPDEVSYHDVLPSPTKTIKYSSDMEIFDFLGCEIFVFFSHGNL
jgi:hypothetical protein